MSEAPTAQPQETLVQRVERIALATLNDTKLAGALETARYATSVVVHDAETMEQASKMTLAIVAGKKALAEKKRPLAGAIKAASDMLQSVFRPAEDALKGSGEYLDNQILQHKLKLDREAKAAAAKLEQERLERERQEREAEAKRKAEAAAAEAAGRPAPPPPAPKPPAPIPYSAPPAIQTRTEAGTVSLTWRLKCEMVNPREVPEDWLTLDAAQARAWGQAHAAEEGLLKQEGSSVVCRGVRYWYEPDTHKSSR